MSASTEDGYEDIAVFLQRIKELGEKRDQEDQDRTKKLEEQILQDRKERQARRAERARSISPTKSSPSNTPTASKPPASLPSRLSRVASPKFDTSHQLESTRDTAISNTMEQLTSSGDSDFKKNSAPYDGEHAQVDLGSQKRASVTSPSAIPSSRNTPLAWQRRPTSQSSDRPRSRPLSMVATENAARSPRATPAPDFAAVSALENIPSREDIAQSLASKDPSWFRQTADRGLTSPAYRKNQVEDGNRSDRGSSSRVQMPGMSREAQGSGKDEHSRSSSPSRTSNTLETGSVNSNNITSGSASPMPHTSAQRFDPPTSSYATEVRMSPSQGRISPERPDRSVSPTKGMGGFVQSAMLKRSDSVQKRWSVQSPTGLSRGDSVASNRSCQDLAMGTASEISIVSARNAGSGQNSSRPTSRPTSSHSHTTATQERPGTASSMKSTLTISTSDGFVQSSISRSENSDVNGNHGRVEDSTKAVTAPPTSPSKGDQRRWSPTKSSWLESALNKPESPKVKTVPPPQQPAWMSELGKVKKSSMDLGRNSPTAVRHEVSIGGLLRSPPPGGVSKPSSLSGRSFGSMSGPSSKASNENPSDGKRNSVIDGESTDMSPARVLSPSTTSPKSSKAKPETPPKKDFRSSLQSRQVPASGSGESEFKNVFGQLRKTRTQNYVAPDELKNNITRGKAALNITGGPKPSERRDEFKEAILKKKEDFKKAQLEGTGVKRTSVTSVQDSLPEALAKRNSMKKLDSTANQEPAMLRSPARTTRDGPPPRLPLKETSAPGRLQKETLPGRLAERLNPALSGLLARGPPSIASDNSRSSSPNLSLKAGTNNAENADGGPQLTHMTKGRARGPRRKAPSGLAATVETKSDVVVEPSSSAASTWTMKSSSLVDPPPLKKVESVERPSSPNRNETTVSQPSSPRRLDIKRRSQFLQEAPSKTTQPEPQLDTPKPLLSPKKANPIEISVKLQDPSPQTSTSPVTKEKPATPFKSPSLASPKAERIPTVESVSANIGISRPPSPSKLDSVPSPTKSTDIQSKTLNNQTKNVNTPLTPKHDIFPGSEARSSRQLPMNLPSSPTKLAYVVVTETKKLGLESSAASILSKPVQDTEIESPTSVKAAKAMWDRPAPTEVASSLRKAPSPIRLPTKHDEEAALVAAGLRSSSPVKSLRSARVSPDVTRSTKPTQAPVSPAKPAASRSPAKLPMSPLPQASEASDQLSAFFGDRSLVQEYTADTTSVLIGRPNDRSHVTTQNSTLYLLSSDGRKTIVPSHQERVLFEQNMYLCFHTFNTSGKKTVEAYHWIGDEVVPSNASSVEAFVQKEAKSAGAKLIKTPQGKETPELFQALGGILIIRRGSASKYDSLAPHILCGRQFFGQIAFDEVDYSPSSLCSGFPYLISTQSGKSYLWKGKGCAVDELSCARLVGMDFGLTGEVVEVDEGNEPPSFLQIFGNGATIPKSADHWRMKAGYSRYCGRLFCADTAAKEQIFEISPFTQIDLSPSKIFILDAFFEIYIIVGSAAQHQYAAFQNALVFVQEYGILAAGMEDRPFVPISTVVIEGIPRDMKAVFRKWKEGFSPTLMPDVVAIPGLGLTRGKSLRVVPLAVAVEATRR